MKTILILEDNDEPIAAFQQAVEALGSSLDLKVWRDAPSMIAECETFFRTAALISLDHDLNPIPAHHLDRFVEALGKTVSVGGDCDTNAAIVCGIVALSAGRTSLPVEWLEAREPVPI